MFVPIAEPMSANELTAVELDALRQNLKFPENEDGRIHSGL